MLFTSVLCNVLFATDSTNCERATKDRFPFSLAYTPWQRFVRFLGVSEWVCMDSFFGGYMCFVCTFHSSTIHQCFALVCVHIRLLYLLLYCIAIFFSLQFLLTLSLFLSLYSIHTCPFHHVCVSFQFCFQFARKRSTILLYVVRFAASATCVLI